MLAGDPGKESQRLFARNGQRGIQAMQSYFVRGIKLGQEHPPNDSI
jgi:hypothetical protein